MGLVDGLKAKLGAENILDGLTDRLSRAHDASIYRLVPVAVARPRDIDDIRAILEVCRSHRVGVTFRAAGTSLSGQAVTDGVLAELGPRWRKARVLDSGARVTSDPGVTGGYLNALLAPHGRRIGPDPASIAAAMIGGIVANNASGMCCGTRDNAYQTLDAMKIVLANGDVIDTRDGVLPTALSEGLLALRTRALAHVDKIRAKYAIKNTMGYALNALVDFDRPVDILSHLLVGSEGTLGFIAEVTLRTVEEPPLKSTALAYFTDLADAGAAVEPLAAIGAAVLELMDNSSMRALVAEMKYAFALPPRCAALLIEFHESSRERLAERVSACRAALPIEKLLAPLEFTEDAKLRAHYWKLRKGLFPKVGAERPIGTAVIIEDICLPRARLAEGVNDLRALFRRHGFGDAVIFGHAKDGNLHFVLCNDFAQPEAVARYAAMMDELATLIVGRYAGSLKAEHGTGRNMAPYVKMEWGDDLYAIMRDVKRLLDPDGVLNPGVLLTDDAQSHLRHLKAMPAVNPIVDRCIECGFCERVCPSRDLTLTPRQRIAMQREAVMGNAAQIEREFVYAGVNTCAGDGLCATVCPVGIDTGAYMRELRSVAHGGLAQRVASFFARHMHWLISIARLVWPVRHKRAARHVVEGPKVVYFEACVAKVMSGRDAVRETLERCGFNVVPASSRSLCCGQPFESKGFFPAAREASDQLYNELLRASDGGKIPIVCDTSPCTARLLSLNWERLEISDFATFMARRVLPLRAEWPKLPREIVLHPTCSSIKNETVDDLVKVARAFARDVTLPLKAGCCGFAGDKGFTVPELTRSATREEAEEVRAIADRSAKIAGVTTCETCAIGMTRATGVDYESLATLCADALRSVAEA